MSTEATARLWKVSDRKYDGTGRPSTDFTVSRDGVFIAAFADERDATDAARAVNAHADLVAELEAVDRLCDPYDGTWPCGLLHVNPIEPEPDIDVQDVVNEFNEALHLVAAALAKGRAE